MNGERFFDDKVAERIWAQYFRRMDQMLRPLDEEQKADVTLEIKGHLLESFRSETSGSEAERLLNAIDRLGDSELFIGPMRADRLLAKASKSFKPRDVLKGLVYHFVGGTRKLALGIVFVLGYILVVCLWLISVLKIFFPRHVGLMLFEDGPLVFGYAANLAGLKSEVLGYWIIPICAGAAIGLYFGLTRLLKTLKRRP
jgi:hypothetical protein